MYAYPVLVLFFFASAGMFVQSSMTWTLLPYMESVGYHSVTLYIRIAAIPILIPAMSSSLLAFISAKYGAAITMVFGHLAVAFGILLVLTLPQYLPALFAGTILLAMVEGMRIVRIGAISDLVSSERRTSTMAVHFFMSPLGAVFGPLAWLAIGSYVPYYLLSVICMVGVSVLAWKTRNSLDGNQDVVPRTQKQEPLLQTGGNCGPNMSTTRAERYGTLESAAGTVNDNDETFISSAMTSQPQCNQTQDEQRSWTRDDFLVLMWFICCILPIRLSLSLQMATFQPALLEKLGWDADSVARSYLIVALASTIPPLIVAVLSTKMSDRAIAVTGVALKFIGAILYLPILPASNNEGDFRLQSWQIVAGFVLAVKATAFFMPCMQSVLTKRVRGRARRVQMMGLVWTLCNETGSLAQIVLASVLMSLLGSWRYAIVVLPYAVSAFMVLYGPLWRYVAPLRENQNEEKTNMKERKMPH